MSLNPGGVNSYGWNYSKPDKPGYSTQLVGTVLAIQEVQKMGYTTTGQPGAPQFWPDGNPMMNIRLALATETGELKTFTFQRWVYGYPLDAVWATMVSKLIPSLINAGLSIAAAPIFHRALLTPLHKAGVLSRMRGRG